MNKGDLTLRWTVVANTCPTYQEFTITNSEPDYPVIDIAYNQDDEGNWTEGQVYQGARRDGSITYDDENGYFRVVVCEPDIKLHGSHLIDPTLPAKGNSDAVLTAQTYEWQQVTGGGTFSTSDMTSTDITVTGLTWGDNIINLSLIHI